METTSLSEQQHRMLEDRATVWFFGPVPPHVLCGLRGPPSWA